MKNNNYSSNSSKSSITLPHLSNNLRKFSEDVLEEEGKYLDNNFSQLDFSKQKVKNIRFSDSSFHTVDFSEGKLEKLYISDCVFQNSNLANADWNESFLKVISFENCRLTGLQLNESILEDVIFIDCKADYIQLQGINKFDARAIKTKRVMFERCILSNSYFQGSDLSGVVFKDCDLSDADFSGVKLLNADFRGSKIDRMRIDISHIKGAIFDSSQIYYLVALLGVRVEL